MLRFEKNKINSSRRRNVEKDRNGDTNPDRDLGVRLSGRTFLCFYRFAHTYLNMYLNTYSLYMVHTQEIPVCLNQTYKR